MHLRFWSTSLLRFNVTSSVVLESEKRVREKAKTVLCVLRKMDQRNCNLHPSFQSKPVYVLDCGLCESTVCVRGMKAMLLADRSRELYSTDLPPPRYAIVYAIHTLFYYYAIPLSVRLWIVLSVCGLVVAKLSKFKRLNMCLQERWIGWKTLYYLKLSVSDQGRRLSPLVSAVYWALRKLLPIRKYWHSSAS